MTVIDRTSGRATGGFPLGLIPIGLYIAGLEAFILIEMMWPAFPLPKDIVAGLDYLLSGRDGARMLLAFSIWHLAVWLAFVIAPVLLIVAILRKAAFRALLVIWFAIGFAYPPTRVAMQSDTGVEWPMDLISNAITAVLVVVGCAGILYALRSSRMRAFFNR